MRSKTRAEIQSRWRCSHCGRRRQLVWSADTRGRNATLRENERTGAGHQKRFLSRNIEWRRAVTEAENGRRPWTDERNAEATSGYAATEKTLERFDKRNKDDLLSDAEKRPRPRSIESECAADR